MRASANRLVPAQPAGDGSLELPPPRRRLSSTPICGGWQSPSIADGETDQQAYERVKGSKYIIEFHHDEYWPFYRLEAFRFGRFIILTIEQGPPVLHPAVRAFAQDGTRPARKTRRRGRCRSRNERGPIVALDLLLLSLARTQSRLAHATTTPAARSKPCSRRGPSRPTASSSGPSTPARAAPSQHARALVA